MKDPTLSNNALWKGLQQAKKKGLTRAIGVSNYQISELKALKGETPSVNQCRMGVVAPKKEQFYPWAHDDSTIEYCQKHNITYQAWRVIGIIIMYFLPKSREGGCPMENEIVVGFAKKYEKTPAQICLRWVLERGCIAAVGWFTFCNIMKRLKRYLGTGADPERARKHAKENLDVFDWSLTDEEVRLLNEIQKVHYTAVEQRKKVL